MAMKGRRRVQLAGIIVTDYRTMVTMMTVVLMKMMMAVRFYFLLALLNHGCTQTLNESMYVSYFAYRSKGKEKKEFFLCDVSCSGPINDTET